MSFSFAKFSGECLLFTSTIKTKECGDLSPLRNIILRCWDFLLNYNKFDNESQNFSDLLYLVNGTNNSIWNCPFFTLLGYILQQKLIDTIKILNKYTHS